jgi:oligogalacturonide lyase
MDAKTPRRQALKKRDESNRFVLSFFSPWLLGALAFISFCVRVRADDLPTEWIDPDTGHKVVRLSREPGSESLYFHQNGYTPDGKKLVFTTPTGISAVDLQTREISKVVDGEVRMIVVGRTVGGVYYTKDRAVFVTDIAGKETRKITDLQPGMTVTTVNADETLLAGSITHGGQPFDSRRPTTGQAPSRGQRIQQRFDQHLEMELIFIDAKSGAIRMANKSNDWQNHIQFSPTDPTLLMFCHEGPWHKVDRIWTIRSDGSDLKLIHQREYTMEIAGHEFFSADGKMIWYDLQSPRSEDFWVGGYDVATGKRTRYHLGRDEWGVHFNVSPDGSLFSSDGGSPGMVGKSNDGQWINLLRPEIFADRGPPEVDSTRLITSGVFHCERLVNMSKHNYELEPNATFTPDMKWLVFRTNMFGQSQILAVEIKK